MVSLNIDRKSLEKICKGNQVEFLGVFGSVARGEDRPDSDVDLLVRFSKTSQASLLDLAGMEFSLQDMIGKKVDLVTEEFLILLEKDIRMCPGGKSWVRGIN